jgi:polynucleotide 5'-kinase involved in rRNA processing
VSQYIRILNTIRKNNARLSLTQSQADCRIAILERLEYPGIVNLFGPHGSGKTFLGWCLANEERTTYIVEPAQIVTVERRASSK